MDTDKLKPFTEKSLAALTPRAKRYYVFEPTLPGFGVRVTPAGAVTYLYCYRIGGRKTPKRFATLGRVGEVTLDNARYRAKAMQGQVSEGIDPLEAQDRAKGASSIRASITTWLNEHVHLRRKAATERLYRLAAEHITKTLGSLPVDSVTVGDVSRLHSKLRSTPYLANRSLATLSSFLTWCERQGCRPLGANPCRAVEKFPEHGHERYLDANEYARLGKAIRDAETNGTVSLAPLTAIKLLLLTGCRPAEILTLEWSFVDLKASVLRLPDSKTGDRTIHLPRQAVKLLKAWPKHIGSPFVFPGTRQTKDPKKRGVHLVNLKDAWEVLRTTAKLEDVRLYDACRHSYASVAISKHGHGLPVVGELLGHTQAATTKRYAHLHDETARAAVKQIGGSIAAALRRKVTA